MKFMYYSRQLQEKNTIIRPHYHFCYELVYCYSGSCQIDYSSKKLKQSDNRERVSYITNPIKTDKQLSFYENAVIIFEPNVIHREVYLSKTTEMISIGFILSADEHFDISSVKILDKNDTLKKLIMHIENNFIEKAYGYIDVIEAYLTIILNQIVRFSKTAASTEDTPDVEYVINYFNEYFKNPINLEVIAKMSGYCTDHFRVLFKKKIGIPPKQYILNKRMEYADYLIRNTELSLSQIAEECGYNDYFQFSTYFKKYFGVRPTLIKSQRK